MVISPTGQVTGTTREVLDRIALDTGCTFEYRVVPRARAFLMLKRGEVDLVPDATFTRDRSETAHFVEAGRIVPALISLARNPVHLGSIDQLIASTISVSTINGYDYGDGFRALIRDPRMQRRVSTVSSPESAIKVLVAGRVQAILTGPTTIIDAWERFGGGEALSITEVQGMPSLPFGLYMSRQKMSQSDMDAVEQALLAILRSGAVTKISLYAYPLWFRNAFKPVFATEKNPAASQTDRPQAQSAPAIPSARP